MIFDKQKIGKFVLDSNLIEGICGASVAECEAHSIFWSLDNIHVEDLVEFVTKILYPPFVNSPLRSKPGMDVRIGDHLPPPGGPGVVDSLKRILAGVNNGGDPYWTHATYETLHPFMDGNGRSGRALWAWHMMNVGRDPFALPFLHRWYYESLSHAR